MPELNKTIRCIFFVALIMWLVSCRESPYRDYEIETVKNIQPQTDKPLIIAFGDSFTNGYTVKKEFSYPKLLEKRLNESGCGYEALNFGFNKDTTEKALYRLDLALRFPNTELFILELGANDMMESVPIEQIKNNLQQIISEVKKHNLKILLCGFESKKLETEYARNAKEMFETLAKENEIVLMPSFLSGVSIENGLIISDNIHPNEDGVKVIEANIFEKVKPILNCK